MTYDEIMSSPDFGEKESLLKNFYINDIDALSWCSNNEPTQQIFFKDRLEIKKNGKLHSITSPAILFKDGDKQYYIDGVHYEKPEWDFKSKKILRLIKLENILDEE